MTDVGERVQKSCQARDGQPSHFGGDWARMEASPPSLPFSFGDDHELLPRVFDYRRVLVLCARLDNFSDFLPTCLEAAELEIPEDLDGQSFLPQLRGEQAAPREWIHCYYCPRPERTEPKRFVRDKRWKLYGDGSFFDVTNDVLEQDPLTEDELSPEARTAKRKLEEAISSMPAEGQSLLEFVPNDR